MNSKNAIFSACLALAILLSPVVAYGQSCPDGSRCLSSDKARKCLEMIEAGDAGLLEQLRVVEAKLNQKEGAMAELRAWYRAEQEHNGDMAAKIGEFKARNTSLERRPKRWVAAAVSAGFLVFGLAAGYGLNELTSDP